MGIIRDFLYFQSLSGSVGFHQSVKTNLNGSCLSGNGWKTALASSRDIICKWITVNDSKPYMYFNKYQRPNETDLYTCTPFNALSLS